MDWAILLKKFKKVLLLVFRRPKGFIYYCFDFFSALIKSRRSFGLPVHITIEPTNTCNLKCPICETGVGSLRRPRSIMSSNDFRAIVDKIHKHTNSILFYFMGEPFLNTNAYQMIKYAKEKGIYLTTCTNGHFIAAEELLNSGIDEINFQIGGVTEESHGKYRIGSSLEQILKNVRNLVYHKQKIKENIPKIILGLILMRQNESQLELFFKLAKEIGVDEARIIKPCVRTWEQGKKYLPRNQKYWIYNRDAFNKGRLRPIEPLSNRCNWIYFSTVILCNGDVVPCCRDTQGDYVMGNIFKENFSDIWNGKRYREFRNRIQKEQGKLTLCRLCSGFRIPNLYVG